jgi:predicted aminopeptidase
MNWVKGFTLISLLGLSACASTGEGLGYYWQSVRGHFAVLGAARPIQEILSDPASEPWLKEKLQLASEVRQFASTDLGLPENGSYTRYTDLKRPFVVWNVFATPELSMQLKQWCYPVVGCATYRGFYAQADAQAYAQLLNSQGLEAYVAGIPAYSTLGWFDDPLLSSFIRYPNAELARTIFHELSHQVLYIQGDTTFNESFATAVEEIALERWLARRPDREALQASYGQFKSRKTQFVALLKRYRQQLEALYSAGQDEQAKRSGKAALFAQLQADYAQLKEHWGGFKGYDAWFAQTLTNAHLATVATYTDLVPGFHALFKSSIAQGQERGLEPFFRTVKQLSKQDKAVRDRVLGTVIPSEKSQDKQ